MITEQEILYKRDIVDNMMEVFIKLEVVSWVWLEDTDSFTRKYI